MQWRHGALMAGTVLAAAIATSTPAAAYYGYGYGYGGYYGPRVVLAPRYYAPYYAPGYYAPPVVYARPPLAYAPPPVYVAPPYPAPAYVGPAYVRPAYVPPAYVARRAVRPRPVRAVVRPPAAPSPFAGPGLPATGPIVPAALHAPQPAGVAATIAPTVVSPGLHPAPETQPRPPTKDSFPPEATFQGD